MGHAQLVAIGALGERSSAQMIVRPAAITPGLRMSSFRIWHIMSSAPPAAV
jgi:hypothetical protein